MTAAFTNDVHVTATGPVAAGTVVVVTVAVVTGVRFVTEFMPT